MVSASEYLTIAERCDYDFWEIKCWWRTTVEHSLSGKYQFIVQKDAYTNNGEIPDSSHLSRGAVREAHRTGLVRKLFSYETRRDEALIPVRSWLERDASVLLASCGRGRVYMKTRRSVNLKYIFYKKGRRGH